MTNVAVLLGAGSSVDAGLPLTNDLASQVVRNIDQKSMGRGSTSRALNYVYSAMVGHRGRSGSMPLDSINIERLISGVRLLRARQSHEVAPFITGWDTGVESFDSHPAPVRDSDLSATLNAMHTGTPNGSSLADQIGRIAHAVTAPGNGTVYGKLEQELIDEVRRLLSPQELLTWYLSPLAALAKAQPNGLMVATLNYDLTIETMGEENSVLVDTGIDRWRPGSQLEFSEGQGTIALIKLHGSIDWFDSSRMNDPFSLAGPRIERKPSQNSRPIMVLGDRDKLQPDGPTLALLAAFARGLETVDRLVVVGYSFGDEHVNVAIRNWLNLDNRHEITVVDPSWPRDAREGFQGRLFRALGSVPSTWESDQPYRRRLNVVRVGAAEGLRRGLAEGPTATSSPQRTVTAEVISGTPPRVKIQNSGDAIEGCRVSAADTATIYGTPNSVLVGFLDPAEVASNVPTTGTIHVTGVTEMEDVFAMIPLDFRLSSSSV